MIKSMTAFARVAENSKDAGWVVEIRSLNNRYLDLSIRVPSVLASLENQIKEAVQAEVSRGKVSVAVSRDSESQEIKNVSLNEQAVELYLKSLEKLRTKYPIKGDVTMGDLLRIPGIFNIETGTQQPEKIWPFLKKLVKRTLQILGEAKTEEGRKLSKDIEERLESVAKAVARIEKLALSRSDKTFKKLKERVTALMKEAAKDEERLYREVAFLSERSDITEEIVRMKSHLELFKNRLKSQGEVGRELDFLCQEMNREVNTMGSKSQFFEISTDVVFIKGELEKIREQVQNIE